MSGIWCGEAGWPCPSLKHTNWSQWLYQGSTASGPHWPPILCLQKGAMVRLPANIKLTGRPLYHCCGQCDRRNQPIFLGGCFQEASEILKVLLCLYGPSSQEAKKPECEPPVGWVIEVACMRGHHGPLRAPSPYQRLNVEAMDCNYILIQ